MFLFFEILESGETDFNYTPLEYQSGIAPKKGAVLLNLFSFKTEGKGLLGKTFSAAAGGSGEDTQTSSGETADPGDPEGQNWDISCRHPWGFPPATPHPHCHGAETAQGPSRHLGKRVPCLEAALCPLSPDSFIPVLPNHGHIMRTHMKLLNKPPMIQRLIMAFQKLLKYPHY